jgi:uncharacterized membrane protein
MTTTVQSIDVHVPISTAYNQWTQFESFPEFMQGVERVEQIDDTHLEWDVRIGGVARHFGAEITEQEPDSRVAWTSTDGMDLSGEVTFLPIGAVDTRVTARIDWNPSGVVEGIGAAVGADDHRVQGDLERFKSFIESRGIEQGAWRGEVTP